MANDCAVMIRELVDLSTSSSTVAEYYDEALPVLASAVGFENAIVFSPGIVDGNPRVYGMCPEACSFVGSFLGHFDQYDAVPRRAAELAAANEVATDEQVYADLGIDRTRDPLENEILLPSGVTSVLDLAVKLNSTVYGFISLHRGGRCRRFSSRDLDLLRPIAPVLGVTVAALRTRCEDPSFAGLREKLTSRELQIVALVRQGLSNKEIAVTLGSSPHTVRNQLHVIFEKLSIRRRAELLCRHDR